MKRRRRFALGLAVLLLWMPAAIQATAVHPAQASTREVHEQDQEDEDLLTLDHFVPHVSTVPANRGEQVQLFVRERVRGNARHDKRDKKRAVLVVSTATQTVALQDLPFENYSWMAFLAEAGFDAFALDLTGYGLSPRPKMNDPCNTSLDEQQRLLTPNPLTQGPCPPSYPFRLTTAQTDWDEIDTVVEYIRELRDVEKVSLIGWSLGGPRMGGYAARHPEKVDKLFLLAPLYNRTESSDPPGVVPQRGVPMTVRTVESFFKTWDSQVRCQNQFTPAIRDTLRSTILEFDPLGSTWGTQALWRAPVQTRWGWNATSAGQIHVPTLIIRGDLDTQVPEPQPSNLFEDIQSQKVFVHVACAGHQLVWENQHMILLRASAEWLRHGTFAGHKTGSFFIDNDSEVHKE